MGTRSQWGGGGKPQGPRWAPWYNQLYTCCAMGPHLALMRPIAFVFIRGSPYRQTTYAIFFQDLHKPRRRQKSSPTPGEARYCCSEASSLGKSPPSSSPTPLLCRRECLYQISIIPNVSTISISRPTSSPS
jgi:hypothetical protein